MGRPSPAGSCWQKALEQRHKLIKRKPLAAARDFIGPPPRSLKIILSTSFNAALNLHAKEFKEKLFRNLYKNRASLLSWQLGNAFDGRRFYFYDEYAAALNLNRVDNENQNRRDHSTLVHAAGRRRPNGRRSG